MSDLSSPLQLSFKKSNPDPNDKFPEVQIKTFTSYSFDKNILTPSSPFRFTAPGIDKDTRTAIRSGDWCFLYAPNKYGNPVQISTGFIDETDTHVTEKNVDYVLTGRDVISQLVDNACVDVQNQIINMKTVNLATLLSILIRNTRIDQNANIPTQLPNGPVLFQTNPGETKLDALQRYLEFTNCLVWASPDGRITIGKPNFTKAPAGRLYLNSSDPSNNNVLEGRSKRNVNQAIRRIVCQLQTMGQVDPTPFTNFNHDQDVSPLISSGVGRSVFRFFSYGGGDQAVNTVNLVGNQDGTVRGVGNELCLREISRDNMKVLEVEMVVSGHVNSNGDPYDIDQIYDVQFEDDDVHELMYVYACNYELTLEHGMLTRLRLCRIGSICAYTDAISRRINSG